KRNQREEKVSKSRTTAELLCGNVTRRQSRGLPRVLHTHARTHARRRTRRRRRRRRRTCTRTPTHRHTHTHTHIQYVQAHRERKTNMPLCIHYAKEYTCVFPD